MTVRRHYAPTLIGVGLIYIVIFQQAQYTVTTR